MVKKTVKKAAKPAAKKTVKKAAVKKAVLKKVTKNVYYFGAGKAEGNGKMKEILGGKGANLAEMSGQLKLPVPPGFTITTEVCTYYWNNKRTYPKTLKADVEANLKKVEKETKKVFGSDKNLDQSRDQCMITQVISA